MLVQKSIEKHNFLDFTETILEGVGVSASSRSINYLDLGYRVFALFGERLNILLQKVVIYWLVLVEHWHNDEWNKNHEYGY